MSSVISVVSMVSAVSLAFFLPSIGIADSSTEVTFGWRPTLRRSYVFFGNSQKQIDLPDLVAGKSPDKAEGLVTKKTELARFELEAKHSLTKNGQVFFRVMGGRWDLKLYEDQGIQRGNDFNWEIGGIYKTELTSHFSFESSIGARVRNWQFSGDKIPKHGNMGLMIGLSPTFGPVSLKIENTLAAAWLYDLNPLGAQKDSSVLRIRPQYDLRFNSGAAQFGVEYYHTHTEFFGTQVIPKQTSFMLDDFELSLVVGASYFL